MKYQNWNRSNNTLTNFSSDFPSVRGSFKLQFLLLAWSYQHWSLPPNDGHRKPHGMPWIRPFYGVAAGRKKPFPPTAAPCMHNRSGPSCSSRWQSDGANWKTHCWCPSEHRPGWDIDKASPEHVQDSKVNRHSNVSRMQCNIYLYIYVYIYMYIYVYI